MTGIRNIRGELNVSPAEIMKVRIKTDSAEVAESLKENMAYVEKLARAEVEEISPDLPKPEKAYTSVKALMEVYILLEGLDVGAEVRGRYRLVL